MVAGKYMLLGLLMLGLFSSSCQGESETSNKSAQAKNNILIVYLSRTNNTKAIASTIHEYVGGTLVELELKTPYPEDYETIVDQVAKENETGFLPSLKTRIDNIEKHDVIYVGFPTWGMQLPPLMKSFLKRDC